MIALDLLLLLFMINNKVIAKLHLIILADKACRVFKKKSALTQRPQGIHTHTHTQTHKQNH